MNRKPRLLTLLCWIGLLVGFGGSMLSFSSALPLLESRDRYIGAFSEEAARLFDLSPKWGTPDEIRSLAEKEADAMYGRRGAALPLYASNLILSILLLSGCARTLRGVPTGPSTIHFAAAISIPLHLLDAAHSLVQTHDFDQSLAQVVSPALQNLVRTQLLPARNAFVLLKAGLAVGYFFVFLFCLRRSGLPTRFSDGAGSGPSSP